ncbi:hypothetical protein H6G45_08080 [Synechocystis sp. FACHB-383]|uniref:DUF6883 domain-containing protein n=1 Tax=Synechocystis sp. FACHB-383 TaxID=2692864 RepID=UPI00168287B5|nr:DUF6883 domain-containing protein [Synechocystis sp. FACHB-383]MBD2653449.1 hypothetical protein [Synechocystis sp. FACHB-383]
MKIPSDAIIPVEKLTCYLLIFKPQDDKSKFLAQAGFTLDAPENLERAIRILISTESAIFDGNNEYGKFYRVEGPLQGTQTRTINVVTIWIQWHIDQKFRRVSSK